MDTETPYYELARRQHEYIYRNDCEPTIAIMHPDALANIVNDLPIRQNMNMGAEIKINGMRVIRSFDLKPNEIYVA